MTVIYVPMYYFYFIKFIEENKKMEKELLFKLGLYL